MVKNKYLINERSKYTSETIIIFNKIQDQTNNSNSNIFNLISYNGFKRSIYSIIIISFVVFLDIRAKMMVYKYSAYISIIIIKIS